MHLRANYVFSCADEPEDAIYLCTHECKEIYNARTAPGYIMKKQIRLL